MFTRQKNYEEKNTLHRRRNLMGITVGRPQQVANKLHCVSIIINTLEFCKRREKKGNKRTFTMCNVPTGNFINF